jgi:hypothetical protein
MRKGCIYIVEIGEFFSLHSSNKSLNASQ